MTVETTLNMAANPVTGQQFVTGDTAQWFAAAIQFPTKRNLSVQLGVHFEEVAETLSALRLVGEHDTLREALATSLSQFADLLKQRKVDIDADNTDWPEVGDGLADTRVTSIGSLAVIGADVPSIVREVDDSNFSKFVDGKPVFDENGKIAKGPAYFRPDVKRFIPLMPSYYATAD